MTERKLLEKLSEGPLYIKILIFLLDHPNGVTPLEIQKHLNLTPRQVTSNIYVNPLKKFIKNKKDPRFNRPLWFLKEN